MLAAACLILFADTDGLRPANDSLEVQKQHVLSLGVEQGCLQSLADAHRSAQLLHALLSISSGFYLLYYRKLDKACGGRIFCFEERSW